MPTVNSARHVVALSLLLVFVAACNENAAYARVAEAHRLAVVLGTEFARATNASDRAVMADTDDASVTFAKEATLATMRLSVWCPQVWLRIAGA